MFFCEFFSKNLFSFAFLGSQCGRCAEPFGPPRPAAAVPAGLPAAAHAGKRGGRVQEGSAAGGGTEGGRPGCRHRRCAALSTTACPRRPIANGRRTGVVGLRSAYFVDISHIHRIFRCFFGKNSHLTYRIFFRESPQHIAISMIFSLHILWAILGSVLQPPNPAQSITLQMMSPQLIPPPEEILTNCPTNSPPPSSIQTLLNLKTRGSDQIHSLAT